MMAPTTVVIPNWNEVEVMTTWKEKRTDKEDQVPRLRHGRDGLQHGFRCLHLLENTHDLKKH